MGKKSIIRTLLIIVAYILYVGNCEARLCDVGAEMYFDKLKQMSVSTYQVYGLQKNPKNNLEYLFGFRNNQKKVGAGVITIDEAGYIDEIILVTPLLDTSNEAKADRAVFTFYALKALGLSDDELKWLAENEQTGYLKNGKCFSSKVFSLHLYRKIECVHVIENTGMAYCTVKSID